MWKLLFSGGGINLWWGEGGRGVWGSTGENFASELENFGGRGGDFWASGGDSPHPPIGKNPGVEHHSSFLCLALGVWWIRQLTLQRIPNIYGIYHNRISTIEYGTMGKNIFIQSLFAHLVLYVWDPKDSVMLFEEI